MSKAKPQSSCVLCINHGGYPESLKVRKVYVTLPDERAAEDNFIRVIDETGEDYLYPAELFVPIQVPPKAADVLFKSAHSPNHVQMRSTPSRAKRRAEAVARSSRS